jgi:hypothetical protein
MDQIKDQSGHLKWTNDQISKETANLKNQLPQVAAVDWSDIME